MTLRAVIIKRTYYIVISVLMFLAVNAIVLGSSAAYVALYVLAILLFHFYRRITSIKNHFHVTWAVVTLRLYRKIEQSPPVCTWLVSRSKQELNEDEYKELDLLTSAVEHDFIDKKVQEIKEYRHGIVTYYDLANILLMCESILRLPKEPIPHSNIIA